MSTSTTTHAQTFPEYLKTALEFTLQAAKKGTDDGDLALFNKLCRSGVAKNRAVLTAENFLESYLWCVGGIQQRYTTVLKYSDDRKALFRQCSANAIVSDVAAIRMEWSGRKCGLNKRKVEAVLSTAQRIVDLGWDKFLQEYLPLPKDPQSENSADWYTTTHAALDRLQMVGVAIAWYLMRNLLGVPVFKPDVHILEITKRFFGGSADPMQALADAAKRHWPEVCTDKRFLPVHLGEVDYVLWFYRSNREPEGAANEPLGSGTTPMDEAPITRDRIDGLLSFLPLLGTPGPHTEPEWKSPEQKPGSHVFVMPYPSYPEKVEDFFRRASGRCWSDYGYDPALAGEMVQDDAVIASASLAQIKTMLTYCVRGERFCDGHWGEMIREGRIGAILRRLQQLRDTVA